MHLQHHSSFQGKAIDLVQYFWPKVAVLEELNPSQERKEILQNLEELTAQCRIVKMVQGEASLVDHVLAIKEMVFVWVVMAQSDGLTILVRSD